MSKGCPLKIAFVTIKLDEIQPSWRNGADVTQETKNRIQADALVKYQGHLDELFEDPDEPISLKSIENAIGRARKKLGIINLKGQRNPNSPLRGSSRVNESKAPYISQSWEQSMFVSNNLIDEIKRLVIQYSLQEVKKAISIIEGANFQNPEIPCNADQQQEQEKAELRIPAQVAEVQDFGGGIQ